MQFRFKKPTLLTLSMLEITSPTICDQGMTHWRRFISVWGPPSDLINIDWLGYLLSVYCLYETIQLSGKHFLAKRINPKISGTRKWNKYPSISLDSQCHLIEFSLWGLQSDVEKIKVFQELGYTTTQKHTFSKWVPFWIYSFK